MDENSEERTQSIAVRKWNSVQYFYLFQEYFNGLMFDFSELLFVIFPLITYKKKSVDRSLHLIILMGISQTSLKKY